MISRIVSKTSIHSRAVRRLPRPFSFFKTSDESAEEFFDTEDEFQAHVEIVSDLLLTSRKNLVFCGAGLSTPSGIPDYRSGFDTKLKTGPGKWEIEKEEGIREPPKNTLKVPAKSAWPNEGHLALVNLEKHGLIDHVISQNVDGLLTRAQFPDSKMTELHGNHIKERCVNCGTIHWRDYPTTKLNQRRITERECVVCGSDLRVSLVYFGDSLDPDHLERSYEAVDEANFCLVLGSSLQVMPAAYFVKDFLKRGKNVALVNLQKTAMHSEKTINVHSYTDQFLKAVALNLGVGLAPNETYRDFKLVDLGQEGSEKGKYQFRFSDFEGKRFDSASSLKLLNEGNGGYGDVVDIFDHRLTKAEVFDPHLKTVEVEMFLDEGSSVLEIDANEVVGGQKTARIWYGYDAGRGVSFDRIEYFSEI